MKYIGVILLALLAPLSAFAQAKLDSDQPIEIASDNLEVLQNEHKAIFSGNVIATQGNINMRAAKMIVFYRGGGDGTGGMGQGISRIESSGNVVFTTPTETAQGDTAIYNTDADTIDLLGNVTLTRDKNILKGTKLNYNLATGRSVLNGGGTTNAEGISSGGRVRGLFIPKSD